jgi:hypothetical protein
LADFLNSFPLKPFGQMNWNLVGSIYGRSSLKFHILSFGSFGQAVSEEKILKNWPIRNKNCLWRSCLLMDRDEMSNPYRGPSIDASYQVSVHLAVSEEKIKMWKVNGDKLREKGETCNKYIIETILFFIQF